MRWVPLALSCFRRLVLARPSLLVAVLIGLAPLCPSPGVAESFEPVGPEDRIAILVPEIQTLFVLPGHEQDAVEALGAAAAEDGWYSLETVVSQLMPSGLGILETQVTLLFQVVYADGIEPIALKDQYGYDANGNYYVVFRDAVCVPVDTSSKWYLKDCEAVSWLPEFAKSHRSYRGPYGRCQRSAGSTCVERIEVVEIGFLYLDDRCNQLAGAFPSLRRTCRVR